MLFCGAPALCLPCAGEFVLRKGSARAVASTTKVFTGNTHEPGQTGARSHEKAVEAHFEQTLIAQSLAHHSIGVETNASRTQSVEFGIDNTVGQTEFGNAVFQNAAYFVKSLENISTVPTVLPATKKSIKG